MNKKFSTLVAVLLAAGAWTTLDAKVVEVTTPAVGGSYLIGLDVSAAAGNEGTVTSLLQVADITSTDGASSITSSENAWTLEPVSGKEADGWFYLKAGGKYIAKSSTDKSIKLSDELSSADATCIKFVIDGNEIHVAEAVASTTIVAGDELKLANNTAVTIVATGTDNNVKFAVYGKDDYEGLPGLDNVVLDENGAVTSITATTVGAPFYFNDGTNYLSVTTNDDGDYVLVTKAEDQISSVPNASQSLSASWKLVNGKLISVASELAGKTVALTESSLRASTPNYTVAPVATAATFTLNGGVATLSKNGSSVVLTGAALSVSSTVAPIADDVTIGSKNVADGVIIGGTYDLLTSAPSDYCLIGVAQSNGSVKFLKAGSASGVASADDFDADNYTSFLWKVSEQNDNDKIYRYTFTSLATDASKKAIKWLGVANGTAQFVADAKYTGAFTLTHEGTAVSANGTVAGSAKATISFYKAPVAAQTLEQLNGILNPGFEVTLKKSKDGKETIEGADMFNGHKMYAVAYSNGTTINNDAVTVQLWDKATPDDKSNILVLDTKAVVGENDKSGVNGTFKWVTKKAFDKDATGDKNYKSYFQFTYSLNDPSTDMVGELKVMNNAAGSSVYGSVYVLRVDDEYILTTISTVTDNTKLPYIKLAASNVYPVKELVGQFLSFTYADTKANAKDNNEEYKFGGILAVVRNNATATPVGEVDYTTVTSTELPEAQWAIVDADLDKNTFTLENRENNIRLADVQLRQIAGDKFEMTAAASTNINRTNDPSDIVILTKTALKDVDMFDGYMQTTENALRNEKFYLGQYHGVAGNSTAYYVENHTDKASHQIGMTAEKESAQKWNLRFAMKADDNSKYTEVDTVFVETVFLTLDSDGKKVTDAKKKTKSKLAILPYTFQNASNSEFIYFNDGTKLEFYACDPDNKDNSEKNYAEATRFALKMKPNNTYNFVTIAMEDATNPSAVVPTKLEDNKLYVANSADKGSLKKMKAYAEDNNSLMVVEKAEAPEYHKIAVEWGDTISLYREENNAQVLYEKCDIKSVVDKDTLSFLNIDNINQFSVNPAIFADTAYINRTIDSEANTCYQYLLAVNVDKEKSFFCPYNSEHNTDEWRAENGGPCADAKEHRAVYGRFLINLIDTANVYGVTHLHNNPYINEIEAGEDRAKLSFVEGYHADDTLYVTRKGGEVAKIAMDSPEFNVAKFAFRYVDNDAKTFKIQTQYKEYLGDKNIDPKDMADYYADNAGSVTNEGYLKWINGTVVVTRDFENGDVFGISENVHRDPVANEDITTSSISVIAQEGKVIINGAQGKKVTISNVLGQTVASTVISSDKAEIAVPAGVVVVAVESEAAVKAIVK